MSAGMYLACETAARWHLQHLAHRLGLEEDAMTVNALNYQRRAESDLNRKRKPEKRTRCFRATAQPLSVAVPTPRTRRSPSSHRRRSAPAGGSTTPWRRSASGRVLQRLRLGLRLSRGSRSSLMFRFLDFGPYRVLIILPSLIRGNREQNPSLPPAARTEDSRECGP